MPEAYRTADASAYASVMDFDEGLDDDYEEEDDDGRNGDGGMEYRYHSTNASSHSLNNHQQQSSSSTTNVKSFLTAGCTFSFGSVAQCGLLGGLAQFLWSCVRNIDNAVMGFVSLQQRRRRGRRGGGGDSSSGFRGMDISIDDGDAVDGGGRSIANPRRWKRTLVGWWRKMDVAIRGFVRSHPDLAMSHVAAYFKSYQRAANDVALLIETSGVCCVLSQDYFHRTSAGFSPYSCLLDIAIIFVSSHSHISCALLCTYLPTTFIIISLFSLIFMGVESIIHNDITTHLCSSVGRPPRRWIHTICT